MSSLLTASEGDLCKLAAIVTAERADLPEQGLPLSLLSDLMDQIRCDAELFQGCDSGRQGYWSVPVAERWHGCGARCGTSVCADTRPGIGPS